MSAIGEQLASTRCWALGTRYKVQCGADSTHLLAATSEDGDQVSAWACRQHIGAIADYVQQQAARGAVRLTAIAWHK